MSDNAEFKKILEEVNRDFENEVKSRVDAIEAATAKNESVAELKSQLAALDARYVEQNTQLNALAAKMTAGSETTGSDAGDSLAANYTEIFTKSLRGFNLTDAEMTVAADYQKSMNVSSGTNGGFLVPTDFAASVLRQVEAQVPFMSLVRRQDTTFGEAHLPLVQIGKGTAGIGTEVAASANVGEPTYAKPTVKIFEIDAKAELTRVLIRDAAFDVLGEVASNIADVISDKLGNLILNGAGTTEPLGLIGSVATTSAYNQIKAANTASNTAFTTDELITVMFDLAPRDRANGGQGNAWVLSTDAFVKLRQLRDGSNNHIWSMGDIRTGSPATLFGVPVYESPYFDAFAATKVQGFYGNWSKGAAIVRHTGGDYIVQEGFTDVKVIKYTAVQGWGFGTHDARALRALRIKA